MKMKSLNHFSINEHKATKKLSSCLCVWKKYFFENEYYKLIRNRYLFAPDFRYNGFQACF